MGRRSLFGLFRLNAIFGASGGIVVKTGAKSSRKSLFAKGFVIEFANPKALLYFAAILPQILLMGATTILLDFVSYSLYPFLGFRLTRNAVKEWVVKSINRVAGGALIFAFLEQPGKLYNDFKISGDLGDLYGGLTIYGGIIIAVLANVYYFWKNKL